MAATDADVMEIIKNEESWELPEEEDFGFDRTVWKCDRCPCFEACSSNAWTNGKVWSFIGEHRVRCYLARHLVYSTKHSYDVPDAMLMATTAVVTSREETAAERNAERREAASQAAKAAKASGRGGRGGGFVGGKGSGGGGRGRDRPFTPSRSPRRSPPRRGGFGGAGAGSSGSGGGGGGVIGAPRCSPRGLDDERMLQSTTEKLSNTVDALNTVMQNLGPAISAAGNVGNVGPAPTPPPSPSSGGIVGDLAGVVCGPHAG